MHDYKVVKGKVIDTVTGKTVKGLKVCKDAPAYFVGDNSTKIDLSGNWDETIEAIIDYDEKKLSGDYPVFYTYIPSWIEPAANASFNLQFDNGVYNLKFERASVDPYQSHWLTVDSNFLREDGLYVYEKMPKRDIFVAVATDYTNQKSYARINGTATNVKLENKGNAYKYYRYALQEMVVTSNHKIKELKIYSDVRNADQLRADYKRTGIASTIKEKATGTDGIVGLGCTVAWTLDTENNLVQQDMSNKKAGVYQVKTKTGAAKTVGIAKYNPVPDKKVSNKGYQSLHITNKRKTILKGKQYPLTAFPYPLKATGSSNSDYDIVWTSSNKKVATVVDGLIIAKKAGKAKITITGNTKGEDFKLMGADDLLGVAVSETAAVAPLNDAAYIKDLAAKAASDAGYNYTYEDLDINPGYPLNPLKQADAEDKGFTIFTLRFAVPREVKTRDEVVHQIVQVAFPTGAAAITTFEAVCKALAGETVAAASAE